MWYKHDQICCKKIPRRKKRRNFLPPKLLKDSSFHDKERDSDRKAMSRSLVKRFVPYMSARIKENHRMLNRYSSVSSALKEASSSSMEAVHLSENCIRV